MHQPPLQGRPFFAGKRVLLIDPYQPTRHVRAGVLQSQDIEVHVAESLSVARCLWRPKLYDWVLLDVRRYLPGELFAFCEQIRDVSPGEHFAFFVGPPQYLSLSWPEEVTGEKAASVQSTGTVKRFQAAAWLVSFSVLDRPRPGRLRSVWRKEPTVGPLTRGAALDVEEDLDQLEVTGQFLEDLATRVASDEGRRCCLDAAQGFRLAALKRKQSRGLIGEDTIAA